MHSKEWPLIIFTMATQLSVGVFGLLWGIYPQLLQLVDQPSADQFNGLILLAIVLLLTFGVVAATLHLGNPFNAYLALSNWRTSWLSREMILGVLFGGLMGLFAMLHWLGASPASIRLVLGGLTSLVGLALVFGIAKLYMLRTVPAWNTSATPITFFATTFLLGSLIIGAALALSFPASQIESIQRFLGILALLMLGTQLITYALHTARLGGQGGAAAISARRLGIELGQVAAWRMVLASTGVALFVAYAFQVIPLPSLSALACGLGLLSEVLGRILFYESYTRVGI